MSKAKEWRPPLSRPVAVATVPGTGLEVKITPDAAERAAMAKALDLAAVDQLTAELRIAPRAGGIFEVSGLLSGTVQPVCVVSLEPFAFKVREEIEMRFSDRDHAPKRPVRPDSEEDISGEDPPDPVENGIIDLGHVATEFLALALPIYPRKPGAEYQNAQPSDKKSPFDQLKALKTKE